MKSKHSNKIPIVPARTVVWKNYMKPPEDEFVADNCGRVKCSILKRTVIREDMIPSYGRDRFTIMFHLGGYSYTVRRQDLEK